MISSVIHIIIVSLAYVSLFIKADYAPLYYGTCNNKSPTCTELRCFEDSSSWTFDTVKADGSQKVTLSSCLDRTVDMISVSDCVNTCTKTESVKSGAPVYSVTIPGCNECIDVCVYVHDDQYKLTAPNNKQIDETCLSCPSQRCNLCDKKFTICKVTAAPTTAPTLKPSKATTLAPTRQVSENLVPDTLPPAAEPTAAPTVEPTAEASDEPSEEPTAEPTIEPTAEPSQLPTVEPTAAPTTEPSQPPTVEPTAAPTTEPTENPTVETTMIPTRMVSENVIPETLPPAAEPTVQPSTEASPTNAPTHKAPTVPASCIKGPLVPQCGVKCQKHHSHDDDNQNDNSMDDDDKTDDNKVDDNMHYHDHVKTLNCDKCGELNCFSEESSWKRGPLHANGTQVVKIKNCLKKTTDFLSFSNCCGKCTKTEEACTGEDLYQVTIPKDVDCVDVCVYAHDYRYKLDSPNPVEVREGCICGPNERCNLCDYKFQICKKKTSPTPSTLATSFTKVASSLFKTKKPKVL